MAGVALIYLSQYQAENKDIEQSLASLDKAKTIYDELFDPGHANHGDLMVYRAIALNAGGNQKAAAAICAKGLAIMEKSATGDPAWVAENKEICTNLN